MVLAGTVHLAVAAVLLIPPETIQLAALLLAAVGLEVWVLVTAIVRCVRLAVAVVPVVAEETGQALRVEMAAPG